MRCARNTEYWTRRKAIGSIDGSQVGKVTIMYNESE